MAKTKKTKEQLLELAKKRVASLTKAIKKDNDNDLMELAKSIKELFKDYPKFNNKEFTTFIKTNVENIATKLQWQKQTATKTETKTTSSATTQKATTTSATSSTTQKTTSTGTSYNSYRN